MRQSFVGGAPGGANPSEAKRSSLPKGTANARPTRCKEQGVAAHGKERYSIGYVEDEMKLTAVFQKVDGGYVGFVEELPGANTQGRTLAEVRTNLVEAVDLVLDANRKLAEEELVGQDAIREPFLVPV
jgi:predicted RNase H-like HicB family nuclease